MVRLFFRIVAFVVLAGAFVAVVVDGTKSVAAGAAAIVPLGRTITAVAPNAFATAHIAIETHVPVLWDPVLVTILLLPTWIVLGAVALVMLALTRRPIPTIGYSRR